MPPRVEFKEWFLAKPPKVGFRKRILAQCSPRVAGCG